MLFADRWKDFELLDSGDGEKLERWGDVILQRPDPQAIWPKDQWPAPDARYIRSSAGGGQWQYFRRVPKSWEIGYEGISGPLKFLVEPTNFKHTGIFPEQAVNWDFMDGRIRESIKEGIKPRILNLFAYTGAATVACSMAGAAEVVHVDASKGMNQKAKDNLILSGIGDNYVRYITEDVNKFVERELRRDRRYEGIIMDPPAYGRGPGGELWKLEDALFEIVSKCSMLLSSKPVFFIINSYTTGLAPSVLSNMLSLCVSSRHGGTVFSDEIGFHASMRAISLPCGATGRWQL
ncbi:MAG: class I SAM-dependent methyltransferase [Saccharofermentanales bacterium]